MGLMIPLAGAIAHEDSLGNQGVIRPDDVMFMSAGTGIRHSQFNALAQETDHHLQLWLDPAHIGTPPRIEQRNFPIAQRADRWQLVASPDGALGGHRVDADARVYRSRLHPAPR